MVISGTRQGMVRPKPDEGVPLEVRIGEQTVGVWLDHRGIHFQPVGAGVARGFLPWDVAIALSLVPADLQRRPHTERTSQPIVRTSQPIV